MLQTTLRVIIASLLMLGLAEAKLDVNNLIGFGGRVATPATAVTVVTTTTSTTATISAPASVEPGDVLLIADEADNVAGNPTLVVPTGFIGITTTTGNTGTALFSYRIADGSEDSASITGMDGDQVDNKILMQFRSSNGPIVALKAVQIGPQSCTANDPAALTMTVSAVSGLTIGVAGFTSNNTVNPHTSSITPDEEYIFDDLNVEIFRQVGPSSDYTWDMDDEGSPNCLFGFYFHAIMVGPTG